MPNEDGVYEEACRETLAEYIDKTVTEIDIRLSMKLEEKSKLYAEMNELESLKKYVECLGK